MNIHQYLLAIRKRILLLARCRYFVVRRGEIYYLIDILNHIDRQIEAHGGYEQKILSKFIKCAKELNPSVFIDVGANLGLYSISMAREFMDTEIIAFEPDRRNMSQLYANIFLNDLQDRISVYEVALSENDKHAPFLRFDDENLGHSRLSESGELLVLVKKLDTIFVYNDNRIAIKIDVEGHELEVLRGSKDIICHNNCIIQLESFNPKSIKELLHSFGYRPIFSTKSEYIFAR